MISVTRLKVSLSSIVSTILFSAITVFSSASNAVSLLARE